MNKLYQIDCMEYMQDIPDNHFDLAVVDPPYGIKDKIISGGETNHKIKLQVGLEKFNDIVPTQEYFNELFRISKNQIIWGGNYFVKYLEHSRGWIVWDKSIPDGMSYAKAELAYTSFNVNLEIFRPKKIRKTFHPTEKPIALYKWLLTNYAKPGYKLFDSHSGSGSFRIAAHDMGFDLTSCELDPDYCRDNEARYQKHIQQIDLFKPEELQKNIYDGELFNE